MNMIQIEEDRLNEAYFVMISIRAISDLLCDQKLDATLQMVKSEHLEALLTLLADKLEKAINIV